MPVLDAITVLGTGLETPLLESPASVTVIDQEMIAESPPSSVAELLRDVPGVEISSAGVPGAVRIALAAAGSAQPGRAR
jgi:hemoglobin/transferrin/lactoferrin receptor protein